MIILGIDPGSRYCGYGILEVEKRTILSAGSGVIKLNPKHSLQNRLRFLYDEIKKLVMEYKPQAVAVETIFYGKNIHSAFTLGHVRGVVLLALSACQSKLYEVSPREVKRAVVGNGNASKEQVFFMVNKILKNRIEIPSQDAADGLAIAICAFHQSRFE